MTAAITVENLSKAYRIGAQEEVPDTLVGAATSMLQSPWRNFRRLSRLDTFNHDHTKEEADILWALRDVSFEVAQGEVVGIIGRNGAGKSTLLKILSRITEPTSGRITIRGRVSSLLEVGTGFHPELTGRENIYMNGTILGMTKREIDRKFDEIVDFSGVEKFLDTPVKRYSSGMSVRLAFAVAAHLEPEILVIDEVLAVGDAEFQRKCLGKMQDVAQGGRTVLFVSHNMSAVHSLCPRAILLYSGGLRDDGPTDSTLSNYVSMAQTRRSPISERTDRGGAGRYRIVGGELISPTGNTLTFLTTGSPALFVFELNTPFTSATRFILAIYDRLGQVVVDCDTQYLTQGEMQSMTGAYLVKCLLPDLCLVPGQYNVNVALTCNSVLEDHIECALQLDVREGTLSGRRVPANSRGSVALRHQWV